MTIQLGFKINLRKCVGCRGCEMACRNEYQIPHSRRKIRRIIDKENSLFAYLSMACNHCANPACATACPNHCFKKRRDGIVFHDPTNCTGCQACVGACPFNAPTYNPKTGKVDKCNLCIERLEIGLKPACVSACISESIELVDIIYDKEGAGSEWMCEIKISQYTKPSVRFVTSNSCAALVEREEEDLSE